jgi:predicted RNA binding protein YcfA (HicA-like mRNA interferase family)
MPRLPTVKPRQVVRALERAGFEIDHQTGSHIVLRRTSDNRRVVVPWHSRDLGRGLTLRIIKSAGLTRDQFIQLLK